MPVVITDYTNTTWAVEDPRDGLLHVGWTGKPGPRLDDVLDFISKREKQFNQFVAKKRMDEFAPEARRRGARGRQAPANAEEASTPQSEG